MNKVQYKRFTSKRRFGVEFEVGSEVSRDRIRNHLRDVTDRDIYVSGWDRSNSNSFWHIKQDSTCGVNGHLHRDYGVEIASYVARGYEDVCHIAECADHIYRNANLQINRNCGLHVHADIRKFSESRAGSMLGWWIKIERILTFVVLPHRLESTHCRLWHETRKVLKRESYTGSELWDRLRPNNLGIHENNDKRVSLNFVNFAAGLYGHRQNKMTAELRLPECIMDRTLVGHWVRLYLLFVDKCGRSEVPRNLKSASVKEFLKIVDLAGEDEFYILSPTLYAMKVWLLSKIIASEVAKKTAYGRGVIRQAKEILAHCTVEKAVNLS